MIFSANSTNFTVKGLGGTLYVVRLTRLGDQVTSRVV